MTWKKAATYLSGPVRFEVSAKFLRGLRYVSRGPVVEIEAPAGSTGSPPWMPSSVRTALIPQPVCGHVAGGG
jgi:hypothetical protein